LNKENRPKVTYFKGFEDNSNEEIELDIDKEGNINLTSLYMG
jgi:hypothetical protein